MQTDQAGNTPSAALVSAPLMVGTKRMTSIGSVDMPQQASLVEFDTGAERQ